MPSILRSALLPELGAAVWRATELGAAGVATLATGHAALDAELPGAGWPVGVISEILQRSGEHNEWRLLLPALRRCAAGSVVLVGAPHVPFVPALSAQGLDARRLLWVAAATPAECLWAAEQALRCAGVTAVLLWLTQARAEQLRRLQMAAQVHSKLLFLLRPAQVQGESSPAALRLLVANQAESDALVLHITKRRGPPLEQPLLLPARPARLAALLAIHCDQADLVAPRRGDRPVRTSNLLQGVEHALGRIASAA